MQNRYIDIHTHKRYSDGTVYVYSQAVGKDAPPPEGTLFSAGVHPWAAGHVDMDGALQYLAGAPVVAIGEIGLDYAVDVDHELQMKVLRPQLEVASWRNLPTIIHCVRAYNDILSILKEHTLRAVIFHGYIGSPQQTADILKAGYYLSFDERSLSSPKTVESLWAAPLDRIFAETDDSTGDVSVVYAKIAELRGISVDELQAAITENFKRIFK